jgi:hypothetical protein
MSDDNKKEYFKKYYQEHKQKYVEQNERRKIQFKSCSVCNCDVGIKSIQPHLKTVKHIKNQNKLNDLKKQL